MWRTAAQFTDLHCIAMYYKRLTASRREKVSGVLRGFLQSVNILSLTYTESYVADFDGRSSLLYRFNQKSMSTAKDVISLRFKSRQAEGVLLHGEGQRGDYITLELHRGKLALHLNLGETRNQYWEGYF